MMYTCQAIRRLTSTSDDGRDETTMARSVSVWILPDQLRLDHPALRLAETLGPSDRDDVRVVLVESRAWMRRLPYHRIRQVLYLSAGRHFAAELEAMGYQVEMVRAETSREGLIEHVERHRPTQLVTMEAAEYSPRRWQLGAMAEDLGVPVEVLPNTQFLVGRSNPIPRPEVGRRYVMEDFYHAIRRHFGLLVGPDGEPTSGRWNFDLENRKRLPKGASVPRALRFKPDAITRAVIDEVEASGFGVGSALGFDLATTRLDAEAAFEDFLRHRLPDFGAFEDAISRDEGVLYHSTLAPQMNLGLLDPLEMARAAEGEYHQGRSPINSVEGFIRQVVGWREFVYWQYHRQMPGLRRANSWGATRPMPRMFWDARTDMACIRGIVGRLIDSAYTHHIERLMVVCNFCLLAGVDPLAVADWFLTFYADSHDWVVLPNVIGMGLNADGGITATKPYVASGAYINRMSDFCPTCAFKPQVREGPEACPFTVLYWNFLIEHEEKLKKNPRMSLSLVGLTRIKPPERERIAAHAIQYLANLEPLTGSTLPDQPSPAVGSLVDEPNNQFGRLLRPNSGGR